MQSDLAMLTGAQLTAVSITLILAVAVLTAMGALSPEQASPIFTGALGAVFGSGISVPGPRERER